MEYVHSSKQRPALPNGPFLVVGLARSGIAAARALAARGESVFGVDSGRPDGLGALTREGIDFETGTEGTGYLERSATVVKSPGVPSGAEVILGAHRRGLSVLGEMELGWRLVGSPMIAITGTNGKTTTTEMVAHLFRVSGKPVATAGNVGTPLCDLALGVNPKGMTVACECSSFQLEDTERFSPECAVFLNLSPDHLDRHGDLDAYEAAKLNIFRHQEPGDVAILNAADPAMADLRPPGEAARVRFFAADSSPSGEYELALEGGTILLDGTPLVEVGELEVLGPHNVANAMAAAGAAISMGLSREEVAKGLTSFRGLAHRLEPVAEIGGVRWVNDSKATNVEATATALGSFAGGIHLILGGSVKGEPFDPLVAPIAERCRAVYLIGETTEELAPLLEPVPGLDLHRSGDLETAVGRASDSAARGETVLLSPACASFDQFSDFEARGDRFRQLVEVLRGA